MEYFFIGGISFLVFFLFFLINRKLKNISDRQERIEANQGVLLNEITKTKKEAEELQSQL